MDNHLLGFEFLEKILNSTDSFTLMAIGLLKFSNPSWFCLVKLSFS